MIEWLRERELLRVVVALVGLFSLMALFVYPDRSDDSSPSPALEDKIVPTGSVFEIEEYQDALDLQSAFVRNAKLLKPTVVSVNNVKEIIHRSSWWREEPRESSPWYLSLKNWFRDFLSSRHFRVESLGSGVVLDADGHILTNYHVTEETDRILIKLSNGREYFAQIVGTDSLTDLAVLKVSSLRALPVPQFGSARQLKVGEWVMAIGNPYGLEGTVTVGVVSGVGRSDLGIATFEDFIQTDASINPGNSGGPLINLNGEVVGVNTAVAALGSGVGFAIPIEMALDIAEQLIEKGMVERGWLGIGIQSMTPELASSFHLPSHREGVLVNSVDGKAPAGMGGILRGDIIIQYDGKKVPGSKKFQQMVAETRIGKIVPIKVIRNGVEKLLHVKIGKHRS